MKKPHTLEDCKEYINEVEAHFDSFGIFPLSSSRKTLRVMKLMWSGWDNQAALLEKAEKKLKEREI